VKSLQSINRRELRSKIFNHRELLIPLLLLLISNIVLNLISDIYQKARTRFRLEAILLKHLIVTCSLPKRVLFQVRLVSPLLVTLDTLLLTHQLNFSTKESLQILIPTWALT